MTILKKNAGSYVRADPPFATSELRRALECAYPRVNAEGLLNTRGPVNEFPILEMPTTEPKKEKPEPRDAFGFTPIPIQQLEAMDLKLEYVVDRLFVGEGSLFVGGQEKTFKTGLTMDLLISLASGEKFLGEFEILQRKTAVMFTAEIGLPTAQQLVRRICAAKGLEPSPALAETEDGAG